MTIQFVRDAWAQRKPPVGGKPAGARSVCNSFDLQILELPVSMPEGNVQLIWHQRVDQKPSQVWLREQVSSLISTDATATQLL